MIKQLYRERFVFTLLTGEAFEGLLIDADENTVRVADAFVIEKNGRHSVDGEVFLPRDKVIYMQKPGG